MHDFLYHALRATIRFQQTFSSQFNVHKQEGPRLQAINLAGTFSGATLRIDQIENF